MERLRLSLEQLTKALETLRGSFDVAHELKLMGDARFVSAAEDSIIQRFEYTYELFWKTLKVKLEHMGDDETLQSPRKIIYAAVHRRMCSESEGSVLREMLDDRNETSHTYNLASIRLILPDIPRYYEVMLAVTLRLHEANT